LNFSTNKELLIYKFSIGSGQDIGKYPNSIKPWTLPAIFASTLKKLLTILVTTILILSGLIIIRVEPNRIAYGHYAGECVGNCGTIYEVTSKIIRVGTTSFWQTQNDLSKLEIKGQRYLEEDDEGNFNAKKFSIPLIMLLDPRTIFGSPDGYDQGGYYLGFTLFGIKRHYQIDEKSEPFYFTSLTEDIITKISDINNELTKYGR